MTYERGTVLVNLAKGEKCQSA